MLYKILSAGKYLWTRDQIKYSYQVIMPLKENIDNVLGCRKFWIVIAPDCGLFKCVGNQPVKIYRIQCCVQQQQHWLMRVNTVRVCARSPRYTGVLRDQVYLDCSQYLKTEAPRYHGHLQYTPSHITQYECVRTHAHTQISSIYRSLLQYVNRITGCSIVDLIRDNYFQFIVDRVAPLLLCVLCDSLQMRSVLDILNYG